MLSVTEFAERVDLVKIYYYGVHRSHLVFEIVTAFVNMMKI